MSLCGAVAARGEEKRPAHLRPLQFPDTLESWIGRYSRQDGRIGRARNPNADEGSLFAQAGYDKPAEQPGEGFFALTQMLQDDTKSAAINSPPAGEPGTGAPPLISRLPPPIEEARVAKVERLPATDDSAPVVSEPPPAKRSEPATATRDPVEVAERTQIPGTRELFPMPTLEEPMMLPGEPYYEFDDEPVATQQGISPYKSGFFQKLSTTGTWLANGSGIDDLGITEIENYITVAVPAPIREWPLLITPAFNIRLFQGPRITDLPPRLYESYVDFMWVPRFTTRWQGLFAVTPSYYSDFQKSDSDAFRIQGKAFGIYDWNPGKLQIVGGILYLDRDDVVILPAGGVIWTPAPWARYEILFPQPKLATRFNCGMGYEDWVYFTAQWGGSTYSIERLSGTQDRVTWTDFRLLVGVERKLDGGAGYRFEAGYVLGREVSYASGVGDFTPSDTWLIRGGITF